MSSPAFFLSGAPDRLLPASVPFRYFAAAAGFHLLAWAVLFAGAPELASYQGGPGLILSALHLLTLGVLVMGAMGAGFQLLPVATGEPIRHAGLAKLSFWLFAPGTLLLAWGMVDANMAALYPGVGGVCGGLAIFAILTARNLRRAAIMPVIIAHGWAAVAALVGFAALGLSLVIDYDVGFLANRQSIAALHIILAAFGFMGLLAFGFSHILIPMFLLARAVPGASGKLQLGFALGAITSALTGILAQSALVISVAMGIGVIACGIYLWLMNSAWRARMRRRVELSFIVVTLSWAMLVIGMAVGFTIHLGVAVPNGAALFGFLILAGWLLTFLSGILQRIMPFLASMHATGSNGMAPLLSELSPQTPLKIHGICQVAALVLVSVGIVLDASIFVRIGAGFGLTGAIAFAAFAGFVISKLKSRKPDIP